MKNAGVLIWKVFASAQCRGIAFYSFLTMALMVAFAGLGDDVSADTVQAPPDSAPQVLVIHSYYPTFTWTDNITRGIRKAFEEDHQGKVALNFEFLDAKRHPEPAYLDRIADLLRMKYPDPGAVDHHML
ncbi:MAG: hypothetical protein P8165_14945 [Deltaproteobacteria bacterium]